jgi:predicted transcriptional regulator
MLKKVSMATYTITKVDQAALISDPFKLKLLKHFVDDARTIKDVAEQMELKQTRLYRHVEALFNAGLITVVKEQQKRGTIEKHYKAIASQFLIDPNIFNPSNEEHNEAINIVRGMIKETEHDIISLVTNPEFNQASTTIIKYSVEGTQEQIEVLQEKLHAWIKECEEVSKNASEKDKVVAYKGLIAFYPEGEK